MFINGSILRVNPHAPSKGNRRSTHSVMANGGSWSPVTVHYPDGRSLELSLKDVRKDGIIKRSGQKKITEFKKVGE